MSGFKLISCRYENFKRHENVTIDFSDTLTVIRGANYKGKSSLLQGIFFALFGMKAVPGGSEVVTRKGSKKKAVVTLTFEDGTDEYTLVRSPTSANLVATNGGTIASGGTAVNEWVAARFSDMKKALLLSFSEQGDSQALLALGAGKINTLIEELSGADYVDRLAKRAGDKAGRAQAQLDVIGDSITSPDEVEESLAAAVSDRDRHAAELATLDSQRQETKTQVSEIQAAIDAGNAANNAARANNEKLLRLSTRLGTHRDGLAGLEARQAKLSHVETLPLIEHRNEVQENIDQLEHNLRSKRTLETEVRVAQEWLDKNKNKYTESEESQRQLDLLMERREIVNAVNVEAFAAKALAKDAVARYESALKNSVCSECKRPFDDSHIEETEEALQSARAAFQNESVKLDGTRKELAEIDEASATLKKKLAPSNWQTQICDQEKARGSALESLADFQDVSEDAMKQLRKALEAANTELQSAHANNKRLKELNEEVEEAKKTIASVEEQLAGLSESAMTDLSGFQAKLSKVNAQLAALNDQRVTLASNLIEAERLVGRLQSQLNECRELWQKRLDAEAIKTRYSMFSKWLRENKAAFLAETWAGILALVSEFTAQTTNGAISEVGRDPDGDFWFNEGGHVMPISAASGGQKSIVGTALRCALPSLLPAGLGFIALDEPSADLDTTHAAALAGALRSIERQVILITHREGEEFLSDSVVVLDD